MNPRHQTIAKEIVKEIFKESTHTRHDMQRIISRKLDELLEVDIKEINIINRKEHDRT